MTGLIAAGCRKLFGYLVLQRIFTIHTIAGNDVVKQQGRCSTFRHRDIQIVYRIIGIGIHYNQTGAFFQRFGRMLSDNRRNRCIDIPWFPAAGTRHLVRVFSSKHVNPRF